MIIQACLNGSRPPGYHPRLPVTPAAIVADANAVARAGANELHVHVRNDSGAETMEPSAAATIIGEIRTALPGALIGVSTGAWIERDDRRRLRFIEQWSELPDYASVNLGEADAPEVFATLHRRGIAVEAGLASLADIDRLLALDLVPLTFRLLVEVSEPELSAAHAVADQMLARVAAAGIRKPILLHGHDATAWSFIERAVLQRFSTRVGLEDDNTLPDESIAGSNAQMVAAALTIWRSARR